MGLDLDNVLEKIRANQWALADIDWQAPGAEKITSEQRPLLTTFMADLVWIEQVGARAFASLAKKAPNNTLKEIYRYFHAEEQRHANAELALMHRWGMLREGETPVPNINIQFAIRFLDKYGDSLPLSALASVIPMLEVALDGALLKFLLEKVEDPLCHRVFEKINADESRHLAVDFHVMEMVGHGSLIRNTIEATAAALRPAILGIIGLAYIPMLERAKDSLLEMGLGIDRLHSAVARYQTVGDRSPAIRRNPVYQIAKYHARFLTDPAHPYQSLAKTLVTLTRFAPRRLMGPEPSWVKLLTHKTVA
jgi:hypothetical protein